MHKQVTDHKSKTFVMMLNDLSAVYGNDKASIKEFLELIWKQKQYRQFNK